MREINPTDLTTAYDRAVARLLTERVTAGHWEGFLSSSALATAIALVALAKHDRSGHADRIRAGLKFLAADVNADGGWGDSPESPSNLTATILCWCALSLAGPEFRGLEQRAEERLRQFAGDLDPASLRAAIERRYGNDRTFAAPILTMCALSGRLGPESTAWPHVFQLPFELALLPPVTFKWLNMTVVSYALPALIAIGVVRHQHCPSRCRFTRALRRWAIPRVLPIAERMQPVNGGYEEATPLTAFVTMSLIAAGFRDTLTVRRAVDFLVQSQRPDGSWPIDTNLATWVTTLSINALPADAPIDRQHLRDWLIGQQHRAVHPLTYGAPGGWAWSDLPGGMPDADDTAGVLLALRRIGSTDVAPVADGIQWLLALQNRDGGIPTFSRGWGKLPFDRSCPDITAHTMRAFEVWQSDMPASLQRKMQRAIRGMVRYMQTSQHADGSWVPLWFGNQYTAGEENPTYGTAQVVIALADLREPPVELIASGCRWLMNTQNADGGWGGGPGSPSSVEETALVVRALAGSGVAEAGALARGVNWLIAHLGPRAETVSAPIGLYFAKLWYSEKLYPLIFTVWALGRVLNR